MSIRRFLSDDPIHGNTARITGDELHHLKHVNRARCGDTIEVIDGNGTLISGEISSLKSNEAIIEAIHIEKVDKPPVKTVIAPSLLKQQPMNLMIEKLSELGVDEIRPVIFTHTDDSYSPSRLHKWQRIASQSLKVNKRLWNTCIFPPVTIDELIESVTVRDAGFLLLLDIQGEPFQQYPANFPTLSIIGPPGGITDEERDTFVKHGFNPFKINDCILKTETAAISIASLMKIACNTKLISAQAA